MLFGQYFLVFGLVVFFYADKKKDALITIPFILVGLACLIVPYLMMNPQLLPVNVNWNVVVPILVLILFILCGLGLVFIPLLKKRHLEKICSYEVYAKIIRYKGDSEVGESSTYCPVYGFWYNGKDWELSDNIYTNVGLKDVGSIVKLRLNPDNPDDFYVVGSYNYLLIVFLGILTLLIAVPIFIFFITNSSIVK
jgi:hypothetical protein